MTKVRSTKVRLSVVAAADAEAGSRSLTVTNPDGLSDTFPAAITVNGTVPGATGDVEGHVFEDLDGNGAHDTGEPGLLGVTISVTDIAGGVSSTATDAAGDYLVANVAAGNATVTVATPPGFIATTGNTTQVVTVPEDGVVAVAAVGFEEVAGGGGERPNFVVVVTDDQRWDTIGRCTGTMDPFDFSAGSAACMPELQETLIAEGTTFLKGEVTQSLCCPSRASILTGQYTTTHGVTNNEGAAFDDSSTIATWLDAAGYRTGLVGKYLNGHGSGSLANHIPPGWDSFHSFHGYSNQDDPYVDYPWINWDVGDAAPEVTRYNEADSTSSAACAAGNLYSTDLMCRQSLDFLTADQATPFFLCVAPAAPHSPNVPADRHAGAFSSVVPIQHPDYNQVPSPNPPSYLPTTPLSANFANRAARALRAALEGNLAVDDLIGALHDQLSSDARLSNTVWIFISDNGYAAGEHRLSNKQCEYLVCHRVPFVVVCPTGVCAGNTAGAVNADDYALNIDIAPTIAALAGATPTIPVDGLSLVPILENPAAPWRTQWFLHESDARVDGIVGVASDGHTYKYVEFTDTVRGRCTTSTSIRGSWRTSPATGPTLGSKPISPLVSPCI